MKIITAVILIGLIVIYFMAAAFHIDDWNVEMIVHNIVRLVSGFVFLGIWVWYKHRLKLKVALYCILALLLLDDIVDYIRHINNLYFEMVIHDTFFVLWGAIIGYIFSVNLSKKSNR
jgi:hypothetical protein